MRIEGHNCEKKTGKIWEVLIDKSGTLYCKSCMQKLRDEEINEKCLAEINYKYRKHERRFQFQKPKIRV
jgi:hypothetical protein